jgi:hypothetical protein
MYLNYEDFKKRAINMQPVTLRVALSEVDIKSETEMIVRGKAVRITPSVLKDLGRILKLPLQFLKEFEKLIGTTGKDKFINFIKDAKAINKHIMVTLIGSPKSLTIVGMQEGAGLSYEMFFKVFEDLMNRKQFDIKDAVFHNNKLAISAVLQSQRFNVGGLDSELFFPGFTLMSDISSGTILESYVYRLVCSNGIIGPSPDEDPLRYSAGDYHFFSELDKLAERNFVPKGFSTSVEKSMKTMASYAELKSAAMSLLKDNSLTKDTIDQYLPLNYVEMELKKRNVELGALTKDQEKTIKTNIPVWDIVNGVTDFASHDYGYNLGGSRKLELQKLAADLLVKKAFDTENSLNISL